MNHLGLTQSAPGQLLRSAGFDTSATNDQTILSSSTGSIQFVTTPDGQVFATLDTLQPPLKHTCSPQSCSNDSSCPFRQTIPDSHYWMPTENSNEDNVSAEVQWPAEEEEKYLETLKSLRVAEIGACCLGQNDCENTDKKLVEVY